MSIRSIGYDCELSDQILCYFMRLILHLQTFGLENLPLENSLPEPLHAFSDAAMNIFLSASSPELSRMLLQTEYDAVLQSGPFSKETILGLQLIQALTWHIYYDKDYYGYLFSTQNLWGNTAASYAARSFYPNLPEEVRERYQDFI